MSSQSIDQGYRKGGGSLLSVALAGGDVAFVEGVEDIVGDTVREDPLGSKRPAPRAAKCQRQSESCMHAARVTVVLSLDAACTRIELHCRFSALLRCRDAVPCCHW